MLKLTERKTTIHLASISDEQITNQITVRNHKSFDEKI